MKFTDRVRSWFGTQQRYTMDDWLSWLTFEGHQYPIGHGGAGIRQTMTGETVEESDGSFESHARSSFVGNPVIFACMSLRAHVFSAVRFQWQLMIGGRPSKLFGNPQLELLERPWYGGTTQDLLIRMITDADLAGTNYLTTGLDLNLRREIIRLRPDWVDVVMEPIMIRGAQAGWRKLGYLYYEGGRHSGAEPVPFGPDEVSCFSPMIDPLATWHGMSWLTPVIREIQADQLMTGHRRKFFENGATPNMIITFPVGVKEDQIKAFKKINEANTAGVENAYKRLYLGGGADATVVGADFQKMTFREVQGFGETRIAAAAGTPPVLVGLSEGLQGSSLNAGNYLQARRRMADVTAHPLWGNVAGSLALLLGTPPPPRSSNLDLGPKDTASVRLWYDHRDVPFLREDEKDAAEINASRASTIRQLVDAGFTPESVIKAVGAEDFDLLEHTNLYSVQLQPPLTAQDQLAAKNPTPAINGKKPAPKALPAGKE